MSFWLQALYLSELLPSSENVLRHMPTNLGLSAHDLDLCVTYLANELEAYKAEVRTSVRVFKQPRKLMILSF